MNRVRTLEDRALLLLVIVVSLAFVWILWPFFSAILWATVLAIVFAPLYRRILRSIGQHPNLAALATLVIIVTLVILPLSLTATSLVQEATGLYDRIQSGELNLGRIFQKFRDALPTWVTGLLDRLGLTNLGAVQERLSKRPKQRRPGVHLLSAAIVGNANPLVAQLHDRMLVMLMPKDYW